MSIISCSDSSTGPDPNNGNGIDNNEETTTYSVIINVTPSNAGSISPSSEDSYEEGKEIELEATSNEEYIFKNWTGDVDTTSDNPLSLTVDQNYNLTANFELKTYELSINKEGEGSITEEVLEQKSKNYEHGTVVELTAEPAEGYQFVIWKGDIEGTDNVAQITVDDPKEVTAVFEKKSYELTVSTDGEGSVSEEIAHQKSTDYEHGTVVELTAIPAEGWEFVEWSGAINQLENPSQIIVDEEKEVTAVFEEVRTELKGIISSNTTLDLSDSPYQLTGKVQIAYGTELKVEKGVEIYGEKQPDDESNVIEIFGDLLIQGSNSDKVLLKDIEIQPGDNSADELYSIEIRHADIIGGELYSPGGVSIYGSIIITNSFLYKVNRSGFAKTYMYIWYPQKDSYIENNIFYNSGRIDIGHKDADVYIRNNLFFRNEDLSNETGYAVENWASYNDSKTVLKNNSFINNNGVAVSLPSGYDSASLDATENYWNTTSSDVIEGMIFDKNDDLSVNEDIPFDSFLNSPNSDTPVLPDSLK